MTASLAALATVALSWSCALAGSEAVEGETVTVIAFAAETVTADAAEAVGSAALVARTWKVWVVPMMGAV